MTEQAIIDYINSVSKSEYDILQWFAPRRKNSKTHWASWEYYKVRVKLRRMVEKGMIRKVGYVYEVMEVSNLPTGKEPYVLQS